MMINGPTYNPPMPPRSWRARMLRRFGLDTNASVGYGSISIPNWLIGKSIVFFFVAFALCTLVWGYPMEWRDAVIASLSVVLFFYGGKQLSIVSARKTEKTFIRSVFWAGLVARLLWVLYCYFIFNPDYYETTWGDSADVEWYMPFGKAIADWLTGESGLSFEQLQVRWKSQIDDVGYPIWLAVEYLLSFRTSDVFVPFVIKAIVSAYCAVCIYNVANRHYGAEVARMAAIFVAFNPNMIYWCGNMFKEAEMVFLCCLSVDQIDKTLMSGKKLSFQGLIPGLLAASSLFFFRAALGIVLYLAIFAHVVMASNRVLSFGKKIIAGVLVSLTLLVALGDSIRTQSQDLTAKAQSDYQKTNMEWRSTRSGGNEFAKYATKAVFAPLIFSIPFPTFNVALESQILQRQLSGGSYIKNILSFFVIMVMFILLISGEWRRHVFILAYTVGYHVVLALSVFAQSGRFHMPVIPMLMLFAAYGIRAAKTNARWRRMFTLVVVLEVIVCLVWNWFKLKGRGMV